MKRVDGLAVSTNPTEPLVALLDGPTFDANGYQRASRINGCFVCPDCDLVWPLMEDVEAWRKGDDGRYHAIEWGLGYGFCEQCNLAVHGGFDCDYVIRMEGTLSTHDDHA